MAITPFKVIQGHFSELFSSPLLAFGTICSNVTSATSLSVFRQPPEDGAAFLDCTRQSYCYAWEVISSLLDALIVLLLTYLLTRVINTSTRVLFEYS